MAESLPEEPLAALRAVAESEFELDRIRRDQVIAARNAGASWQQIGEALGVSRQSAWEMFTAEVRAALDNSANTELTDDEAMQIAVEEVRAVRRHRAS